MVYGAGDCAQEKQEKAKGKGKMNEGGIDILKEAAVQ